MRLQLGPVSTLHGSDFNSAELGGANLAGVNASRAIFDRVNLSGANLSGANLQEAVIGATGAMGWTTPILLGQMYAGPELMVPTSENKWSKGKLPGVSTVRDMR